MTILPSLPTLPGLSWSRRKKPGFSTRVASHVSGREVRVANQVNPLYEFELTYAGGLTTKTTGGVIALGAASLQALMGFHEQMQGQFGTFLYADPDDNTASGAAIGTGDGTTRSFVIQRDTGGFIEPVSWVTNITNVYLNGAAQPSTAWAFTPPNSLGFYSAPGNGVAITADFTFAFQCRFLDDQLDFEEFMSGLWTLDSLKFRSVKANTTAAAAPVMQVIFLLSGTTWTVPSDWNDANNSIAVIGAGGGGAGGTGEYVGGGGGGGAYAQISNVALTPGATLYVNIGAGGAGATGTPNQNGAAGGDTWINIAGANSAPSSPSQGALAKGGAGGTITNTAAQGGQASASVGTTTYSGGNGGLGNSSGYAGSGGGGAAGPNGAGGNGGAMLAGSSNVAGGGGGGGADGGSAGANGTTTVGGAGGNNFSGTGGGAQITVAGNGHAATSTSGEGGGGGGGAYSTGNVSTAIGGAGSAGQNWTETVGGSGTAGPGGGGGGGANSATTSSAGGAAGLYGGGGGAGGWQSGGAGNGGAGGQGIIVIKYV